MEKSDTGAVPGPLSLGRGQSHFAHLARGTVLRVAEGGVRVVQHLALEHGSLRVCTPLQRGGVHGVQVAGWVEIAAQSDSLLWVHGAPPSAMSHWRGLGLAWKVAAQAALDALSGTAEGLNPIVVRKKRL